MGGEATLLGVSGGRIFLAARYRSRSYLFPGMGHVVGEKEEVMGGFFLRRKKGVETDGLRFVEHVLCGVFLHLVTT